MRLKAREGARVIKREKNKKSFKKDIVVMIIITLAALNFCSSAAACRIDGYEPRCRGGYRYWMSLCKKEGHSNDWARHRVIMCTVQRTTIEVNMIIPNYLESLISTHKPLTRTVL